MPADNGKNGWEFESESERNQSTRGNGYKKCPQNRCGESFFRYSLSHHFVEAGFAEIACRNDICASHKVGIMRRAVSQPGRPVDRDITIVMAINVIIPE